MATVRKGRGRWSGTVAPPPASGAAVLFSVVPRVGIEVDSVRLGEFTAHPRAVAALNPCGFALLPTYLTLLVAGDGAQSRQASVLRALVAESVAAMRQRYPRE